MKTLMVIVIALGFMISSAVPAVSGEEYSGF
jgi:hypothetical protein